MAKTLLSLFDYTGTWSAPYLKNGWAVIQIDIKHGVDIMDIDTDWLYENIFDGHETVDGILAAPPCTDFSVSGAQYWKKKDADGTTAKSVELVNQVLRIVDVCSPDFWALENPVGRIAQLVPGLGKPKYFNPHDFGDAYTKKTALYGKFKMPQKTNNVGLFKKGTNRLDEVKPIRETKQGSWLMKLGGKSERTKELRSITPSGFAEAFYQFNH